MVSKPQLGVLFVCTGNICRSPTAEGVFRHMLLRENLHEQVLVDSAGTHDYHVGSPPDRRSQQVAARRGYDLSALRARQINANDFAAFDYLLAMDSEHLFILQRIAPQEYRRKVAMFLDFSSAYTGGEVPDPYYGSGEGFETVLDLIEDGVSGLLAEVRTRLGRH